MFSAFYAEFCVYLESQLRSVPQTQESLSRGFLARVLTV